ncbi:MAG: PKD domain-containing protein, partial [Bacteroidales bacterium]|nr:PKD domain-containing protein [Bacteroidales bacterium]
MKKLFAILIFTIVSIYGFSQFNMVTNNGQSVTTCSNTMTPGSYTVGQTYTLTVCSNDPINRHMTLFISSGYLFPAGTSLCVYDGTSIAAPLLVCFNNTTVGGTIAVQATNMNESGCLHFVFTAGASGAIWNGTFSCSFICQPRQVDIISASPAIQGDGYINVCWDEDANASMPVTFNAQGTYPSTGYTCDDASNTFYWNFQDGTPIVSGLGMTTVNHTFPARQGYTVIVTIEDSQGCENTNAVTQRVRVSRAPVWNTTTTATDPDEICMGENVNFCGYYSATQWSSAIIPANGQMVCVPDNPPLCYSSSLLQNAFEPDQHLNPINDLLGIHMNLAHAYLGDLTFYIQCPNGQEVQFGAQGGGGCYLGNPGSNHENCNDDTGMWYNITPTASQTMQAAAAGQTTLPSGNYASYQSLAGLIGCPLNGLWTIRICDNWSIDAGTIFGWWIEFNPALYPEIWSYTQSYTPTIWEGLYGSQITPPGNTNCASGTYITTGTPTVNSLQPFIFTITDNFGCEHDTSLYVTVRHQLDPNCCVIPSVDAGADAAVCALTYSLTASSFEFPGNTGYWELVSGPGTASFSNSTSPTTNVTVSMYGTYVFEFNELHNNNPGCASNDVVSITFNDTFDPTMTDVDNICVGSAPFMLQMVDFGTLSININPSLLNTTTGQFDPSIPGTYTITNTVQDPCTGGPLSDAVTFTVYDAISVENLNEYCGPLGTPTYFYVEFDVEGSQGNPFTGYLVNGISQANPHYTATI